jgi:hypothetical protein
MTVTKQGIARPSICLIGDVGHADFQDAVSLLRAQSRLVASADEARELIVVAQSRPGGISSREIAALRRASPLAGMVALLGSWCEGETRTGRPWPGIERLYWYEFPAWWRRQLALRAAGRCPDWARPESPRYRSVTSPLTNLESLTLQLKHHRAANLPPAKRGLIVLNIPHRETASAVADVLYEAGYATAWQAPGGVTITIRGATAGIWEGGQLSDREATDLSNFCHRLANEAAPVVALLDFPRRINVDRALNLGATTVLGKPWVNSELIETLQFAVECKRLVRAA